MSFDPVEALRGAGVFTEATPSTVVESFGALTEQETAVLISLKGKLSALLPEVAAHAASWDSPAITPNAPSLMECGCGLWSGSGG
jgi:hypothetical protein